MNAIMSNLSPRLLRRSFLARLGLGAGATILGPLAANLTSEARGEVKERKIAVVFIQGNGIEPSLTSFIPTEFRGNTTAVAGEKNFTWPDCLAPLAPYRDRTLLVDGLTNRLTGLEAGGHTSGFGSLACVTGASGRPGGPTIDQYLAKTLSAGRYLRSINCGLGLTSDYAGDIFATDVAKPLPYALSSEIVFRDVFAAAAASGDPKLAAAITAGEVQLRDRLTDDVNRMNAMLAGPERAKLESFVTALAEFDKRRAARPVCMAPAKPNFPPRKVAEDELDAMADMTSLAIGCGMTNVVGFALGVRQSHGSWPRYMRSAIGTPFGAAGITDAYGHDPASVQGPAREAILKCHAQTLARMATSLSRYKEGDRTLFDLSSMVLLSDNAESHHSEHKRWPMLVVGNAGGKLKADGRFVRYQAPGGSRQLGSSSRAVCDFFSTFATALSVPTPDFGKGGAEIPQGPIADLLG